MELLSRFASFAVLGIAMQFLVGCATTSDEIQTTNPLGNPQGMVDQLVFFDTEDAFSSGEMTRVELQTIDGDTHVVLSDDRERAFPRTGIWVSEETETAFPFKELIASWNATVPNNTGTEFYVRSKDSRSGEWSPWLYTGQWGRTLSSPRRKVTFEHGRIHVDVLKLKRPASAFQLRTVFRDYNIEPQDVPSIRRMAAVYSGQVKDTELRASLVNSPTVPADFSHDIELPFQAQGKGPMCIKGSICSPTSLSMVLHYWGIDVDFVENAQRVYDPDNGIFGNWSRATQRAAELGMDAWVTRIRDWNDLKATIADGQPVIASIKFKEGEFPSNVLDSTNGHLITIRGITPDGNAIVNDPASIERGEAVVYQRDELENAWFGHGGVAYIVRPRDYMSR